MAWLDDNPPVRDQFRKGRRMALTGLIVVHSAENLPDVNPPDTGAESVANMIRRRTDPGSYHWMCDSDSHINLIDMANEAYGDGTGSNKFAIHVSGAFKAHQWQDLPAKWRHGCIDEMAAAIWESMVYVKKHKGIDIPLRRITRAQSEAGWPGFISHGERDPGRRSDPGPNFSWSVLFDALSPNHVDDDPSQEEADMTAPIVELMKVEYRKRRGRDFDPSTGDASGWHYWMSHLAMGKDPNGKNADAWTIYQGFLWIINVAEGPGKYL